MSEMIVSSGFTEEQIQVIRSSIAQGLSDDQFKIFLYQCKRTGLDPFAKQIYAFNNKGKTCIMASIDGLRLIAERTGKYAPGKTSVFTYDQDKNLVSATAYVKKMTPDGTWHEVSAGALMCEYAKPCLDPQKKNSWNNLPHVMLEKCAEARALRRAFPADLSGIYEEGEIEKEKDEKEEPPKVIEVAQVKELQQAEPIKMPTKAQLDELKALINGNQEFLATVYSSFKVDSVDKLSLKNYEKVLFRILEINRNKMPKPEPIEELPF